jgi:hypothetical protein
MTGDQSNNKEDYQDFCHTTSKSKDIRINQDEDRRRAAVLRLVLNIEAEVERKEVRINWDDDGGRATVLWLVLKNDVDGKSMRVYIGTGYWKAVKTVSMAMMEIGEG